jgi:hypothetical protein
VIVTRGLGLPAEGNLALAGFGIAVSPPPQPDPGGGPGNKFRLLTDRLPDLIEDDDDTIAIALTLLVAA